MNMLTPFLAPVPASLLAALLAPWLTPCVGRALGLLGFALVLMASTAAVTLLELVQLVAPDGSPLLLATGQAACLPEAP